jgi:GUN4-like
MEPIPSKENKGIDLKASSIIIAVISAIAGLLGSGIAAVIQGFNQASLEQQKFESNLILKALEPKSQNERAKYLRFLVNTGLVKNLNQDGIKEVANNESSIPRSIPQTPFQSSDSGTAKSYNTLENFLTNKDWKNANISTMEILIDRANSSRPNRDSNQDWLEPADIESLSCSDLRTVDNLWSRASNKRLGFTAQSEIWQSVGGTIKTKPDKPEIRKNFSNQVGWISADSGQFDFNKLYSKTSTGTDFKNLPKGYLPSSLGKYVGSQIWVGSLNEFATLTSKLKQCNISQD